MHILLLVIGLIIGAVFLYRLIKTKDGKEIKSIAYTAATITICIALFTLAVTGRLPAAIAIVAAAWPFMAYWWQRKNQVPNWKGKHRGPNTPNNTEMDKKEALSLLGLSGKPTKEEIKKAHKQLIQKLHPDTGGSEGIAKKLNEARDFLIKSIED